MKTKVIKNNFLLHHDKLSVLDKLSDEDAGKLIKQIYGYSLHINNPEKFEEPQGLSGLLDCIIDIFKNQLDSDLEAYKRKMKTSSEKGRLGNLKRWHPDLYNQVVNDLLGLEEAEKIANDRPPIAPDRPPTPSDPQRSPPIAKIADTDTDTDTDTDIKKEIDKSISKKRKTFNLDWFEKLDFSDLKNCEEKFYLKLKKIESMLGEEFSCRILDLEREKCINWAKTNEREVKDWKATFSNWMIKRNENNNKSKNANDYTQKGNENNKSIAELTKELLEENRQAYINSGGIL